VIEKLYTVQELAELCALNPETIRREVARGNLASLRFGRDFRFTETAVRRWLESKKEAA
jgi:excisionase family DNA binding protein